MPVTSISTPVSRQPVERERRAAGAAGDVEHVARRRFADQIGDDGLLVETSPALLADILTIDFTSNVGGDFALKSSVLSSIELTAIGPMALIDSTHDGPPPQEQRVYVANASHDPTFMSVSIQIAARRRRWVYWTPRSWSPTSSTTIGSRALTRRERSPGCGRRAAI